MAFLEINCARVKRALDNTSIDFLEVGGMEEYMGIKGKKVLLVMGVAEVEAFIQFMASSKEAGLGKTTSSHNS